VDPTASGPPPHIQPHRAEIGILDNAKSRQGLPHARKSPKSSLVSLKLAVKRGTPRRTPQGHVKSFQSWTDEQRRHVMSHFETWTNRSNVDRINLKLVCHSSTESLIYVIGTSAIVISTMVDGSIGKIAITGVNNILGSRRNSILAPRSSKMAECATQVICQLPSCSLTQQHNAVLYRQLHEFACNKTHALLQEIKRNAPAICSLVELQSFINIAMNKHIEAAVELLDIYAGLALQ
jgi:hypothetical protein